MLSGKPSRGSRLYGLFLLVALGGALFAPSLTQAVATPAPNDTSATVQDGDNRVFVIWWFNGENPANYAKRIQLFVPDSDRDSSLLYGWQITQGADKAEFSNGSYFVPASQFNYTVFVRSKGPSIDPADVSVIYTKNGSPSRVRNLTVKAPDYLYNWTTPHRADADTGYFSQEGFRIRDNFNDTLPYDVEVNESKGSLSNDWSSGACSTSNWQFVGNNGVIVPPAELADYMSPPGVAWRHPNTGLPRCPEPQAPQYASGKYENATTRKVKHRSITFYVGSTTIGAGVNVYTKTQQYYRDHAQHN